MLLCNNKKFIRGRLQINRLCQWPNLRIDARILYFKLISPWFNTKMLISVNTFQVQHVTYILFGLYLRRHRTRTVDYIGICSMGFPIKYIFLNRQISFQKREWRSAWGSKPNSFISIVFHPYRNFFSQDITRLIRENDNFLLFINGGWLR